jgi:hypothetical protein
MVGGADQIPTYIAKRLCGWFLASRARAHRSATQEGVAGADINSAPFSPEYRDHLQSPLLSRDDKTAENSKVGE